MVKLKVKTIRVGNSIRVAIPVEILKAANIKQGENLLIDYEDSSKRIILQREKK